MADRKLDIFDLLKNFNVKNVEYFEKLPEDEQKEAHPLVVMRWLSGTASPYQVMSLNMVANPYIFELSNHKSLLMKLLLASTDGSFKRNNWLGRKTNKSKSRKIQVIREYYGYSTKQAAAVEKLITSDDVVMMAEHLGFQKEALAELKKELK